MRSNSVSQRVFLLIAFVIGLDEAWPQLAGATTEELNISLEPPGLYEIASGGNAWSVYLKGIIEPGADKRVAKELNRIPNSPFEVYLDSPGGDFLTGIELGRLLRSRGAWTHIGKRVPGSERPVPGECYSACAMAYLGGFYRFSTEGSIYGVHRTWKEGTSTDSDLDVGQVISAASSAYIREMGVDGGLLDRIVRAGKNEVYVLSDAEQKALRVTNEGRGPARWSLQLLQGFYYLRGVQDTMYGQGKFMLACLKKNLFLFSIYEAGKETASSIEKGHWFHSLMIDGDTIPLAEPISIKNDNGYLNVRFALTPEQISRLYGSRASVGHAMQMSREAPTFRGYTVDVDVAASNQIKEFISACSGVSVRPGRN